MPDSCGGKLIQVWNWHQAGRGQGCGRLRLLSTKGCKMKEK